LILSLRAEKLKSGKGRTSRVRAVVQVNCVEFRDQ